MFQSWIFSTQGRRPRRIRGVPGKNPRSKSESADVSTTEESEGAATEKDTGDEGVSPAPSAPPKDLLSDSDVDNQAKEEEKGVEAAA